MTNLYVWRSGVLLDQEGLPGYIIVNAQSVDEARQLAWQQIEEDFPNRIELYRSEFKADLGPEPEVMASNVLLI